MAERLITCATFAYPQKGTISVTIPARACLTGPTGRKIVTTRLTTRVSRRIHAHTLLYVVSMDNGAMLGLESHCVWQCNQTPTSHDPHLGAHEQSKDTLGIHYYLSHCFSRSVAIMVGFIQHSLKRVFMSHYSQG